MTTATCFTTSYNAYDQYPRNHLSAAAYGTAALDRHRKRLWECKDQLFTAKDLQKGYYLPFRDISASGSVKKSKIHSDEQLRDFLCSGSSNAAANDNTSVVRSNFKGDEACRFVFLCAESAIGPLEISAMMLFQLLSFYQVMLHFLDFLYVYASLHGDDKELHFSGFRTQKTLINPLPATILPELGRSGRQYQLCYNLKTAVDKGSDGWKTRQAAIHHQFDIGQNTQLWIIGDPRSSIKKIIGELYPENHVYPTSFSTFQQSFKSSMDVHLALASWATSEWRWNIRFLEERAEILTLKATLVKEKAHIETLDPGSLSSVQRWEEKTTDTVMSMESNVNILKLLQRFYKDLLKDSDFPQRERRACQQGVKNFCSQLEELICEMQMQIARARVLMKVLAERKMMLIQNLQAQSAIISSRLAASMYDQADRSAIEAIAVRIVTIVTVVYLPATFSSTFFSTDVIKYQNGEIFSRVALDRFLEVTLPLMLLTFVPAGIWFWIERRKRRKTSRRAKEALVDLFSEETDLDNK
ncbi:hypothetical protein CTAM01_08615 [Colletotrichum tamarilloi]|uniref:CorA-like transporter domain-containing protein n=1 Tax=Colletotrichum tamarilloi TaxID=1209934 RepID=A0ABQ9R5Y7_9PEZI|nr:uncharacterized protein CTAM01_08615 [Colletotrichum tamarilloi]KAK1495486.1 hypothetical protein CTAM01_08615 [Colletotrichum tamarilloi]